MFKKIQYYENIQDMNFHLEDRYFILIAEASKNFYDHINILQGELYGGIFPQLIFQNKNFETGCIICTLQTNTYPILIEDISFELEPELENVFDETNTIFTFVDGLSPYIQSFLEKFYEITHSGINIIGGGAGLLTLQQEPILFGPQGIYQNSALLLCSQKEISLGVKHGWEKLSGPYISTSTEHNILKTIDYHNAFDIYAEAIEKDSGKIINETNFFEIAKEYPLGIQLHDGEVVVRDPIITKNGHLILVGEMDQSSTIYILKGNKTNLIKAAKYAIGEAMQDSLVHTDTTFVVDCISRVLYLENMFQQEIETIKTQNPIAKLFGILSLGEIANKGKQYIEFYNKTCVIGAM